MSERARSLVSCPAGAGHETSMVMRAPRNLGGAFSTQHVYARLSVRWKVLW